MTLLLKDPAAVLDYAIDWGAEYLGDDLIAASDWTVLPAESGGVTIAGSDFDAKLSTVKAAGGVAGHVYRLVNDVTMGSAERPPLDRAARGTALMSGAGLAQPIVTMSEAQAYVRIETGEEEAVLAGLVRSASALCEAFLNRVVIARDFEIDVAASGAWQRLELTPVRSIGGVTGVDPDGAARAIAASDYAIDIDSSGDGWVRAVQLVGQRLRVSGIAGMAGGENDVPEPIRQGVLRLVAHLFTSRDGGGGDPPAAVTALWRPYRRLRLS